MSFIYFLRNQKYIKRDLRWRVDFYIPYKGETFFRRNDQVSLY